MVHITQAILCGLDHYRPKMSSDADSYNKGATHYRVDPPSRLSVISALLSIRNILKFCRLYPCYGCVYIYSTSKGKIMKVFISLSRGKQVIMYHTVNCMPS